MTRDGTPGPWRVPSEYEADAAEWYVPEGKFAVRNATVQHIFDTEAEAFAVRDALNGLARPEPEHGAAHENATDGKCPRCESPVRVVGFQACECGREQIEQLAPREARPALTVERLTELLRALRMNCESPYPEGSTLRDEADAAWLLPRLAGPAQEGK